MRSLRLEVLLLEDRCVPTNLSDVLGVPTTLPPFADDLYGDALLASDCGLMSSCEAQYYNHPSHNLTADKPLGDQTAVEDQGRNQAATLPSEKSVGANGHAEMLLSVSSSGDDASYLRTVQAGSPGQLVQGADLTESYSGVWFNSFGNQVYSGWGVQASYSISNPRAT